MIDLNIRKLRSFVLVAEFGNFRRAADKLSISSSALSTQIRELEQMVGMPLFRRTTRKVQITREGARFLTRAQQLLADADALITDLQNSVHLQRGRVTIACVPSLTAKILPLAMTRFSKRYPGITLRILDEGSHFIERYVEDGEADFGIGKVPSSARDLESILLFKDPFVAIVSKDHLLSKRRQVRFAELSEFPFIRLRYNGDVLTALNRAAEESGASLKPIYELTHYYSIGRLIQAGMGITALPRMGLAMVNLTGLTTIPIVAPTITREISVIKQKGAALSSPAKQFLNMLKQAASEIRGSSN